MRLLILCLVTMTLFSCKKERTIHIIAKNPVTGERYAGLTYYVVQEMTSGGSEKFKTVATGSLNSNGEATLTKKFSKRYSYVVRVEEPGNICYNKQISQSFDSPYDVNGTFTFEFAECAYLKFKYHNTNCFDSNDRIEVTRINNLDGYVGFNNPAIYDGCTDYTMPNFVQVPMGWWQFSWSVTKNGITNQFNETIFVASGEQRYYEFNY